MNLTDHPRWKECLINEWHYAIGGNPKDFSHGSSKKVWWKCYKYKHEWKASINKRINGRNCPFCSGKKVLEGYNDLKTTHSELCEEWNCDKNKKGPECYSAGSNKKVGWKCKKYHEWDARVSDRTIKKVGCPYCRGRYPIIGKTDLKTIYPELCEEWNYEKNKYGPEFYSVFSNKKVWWKCKEGHEWKTSISHISSGSRCPYCSGFKVLKGFNDLKTINPKLCKEWNYVKNNKGPEYYPKCSGKKVWWICTKNHEWNSSINNRVYGNSCPECSKGSNKKEKIIKKIILKNVLSNNLKISPHYFLKCSAFSKDGERIRKYLFIDFKITLNKKIKIFVEYNGEQHYKEHYFFHKEKGTFKKQQQRDQWLRNYCKQNNIILIEIDGRKYKTRQEIEPYLLKEVLCKIIQFNKRNKTL